MKTSVFHVTQTSKQKSKDQLHVKAVYAMLVTDKTTQGCARPAKLENSKGLLVAISVTGAQEARFQPLLLSFQTRHARNAPTSLHRQSAPRHVCVARVRKSKQQVHHHALCVRVVHINKFRVIPHVSHVMPTP